MTRCFIHSCTNEARYLNGLGEHLCGVHDALSAWPSVRISDLPELILQLSQFLRDAPKVASIEKLKEVVCLKKRSQ